MAISWADPSPSAATAASLGQAARIDPTGYSLGHIVSSIMQFRQEQAQRQQAQMNNMIAGIERGAQGFANNAQQGRADDAANAAMYGIQNPNDPYGGFQNPDVVPDYGGTNALRVLESAKGMGGFEDPQTRALRAAQLDEAQARAHNLWTYPTGESGDANDINDLRKRQIMDEQNAKDLTGTLGQDLGVTGPNLNAAIAAVNRYKPGVTAFPAIGDQPAIADSSQGDYKDAVINEVQQYQKAMNEIRQRQAGYGYGMPQQMVAPPPMAAAPPSAQAAPVAPTPPPLAYPGGSAQLPSPPASDSSGMLSPNARAALAKAVQVEPGGAQPGATPAASPTPARPVQVSTPAQYASIPSGSQYIDPNGVLRIKP